VTHPAIRWADLDFGPGKTRKIWLQRSNLSTTPNKPMDTIVVGKYRGIMTAAKILANRFVKWAL